VSVCVCVCVSVCEREREREREEGEGISNISSRLNKPHLFNNTTQVDFNQLFPSRVFCMFRHVIKPSSGLAIQKTYTGKYNKNPARRHGFLLDQPVYDFCIDMSEDDLITCRNMQHTCEGNSVD